MSIPSEMMGSVEERLTHGPSNWDHREGPTSQSLGSLATSRSPRGSQVIEKQGYGGKLVKMG